ncbi:MAG: hypothetical protein JSS49_27895 [Planctomycetes bacterium]|nr:hypothetical protein [Planctomycetota bacterium]
MWTRTWKKLLALSPIAGYSASMAILVLIAVTLGVIEQLRFGHNYVDSIMPYGNRLFDVAGYLAFACIAVHLALQITLTWRYRLITTLVVIAFYVSSYCLLSFQGKYHASRSGQHRWESVGLAAVDQNLWHAKGVFWQPFRNVYGKDSFQATSLGYFFSPLIILDRAFVHRTINLFDADH